MDDEFGPALPPGYGQQGAAPQPQPTPPADDDTDYGPTMPPSRPAAAAFDEESTALGGLTLDAFEVEALLAAVPLRSRQEVMRQARLLPARLQKDFLEQVAHGYKFQDHGLNPVQHQRLLFEQMAPRPNHMLMEALRRVQPEQPAEGLNPAEAADLRRRQKKEQELIARFDRYAQHLLLLVEDEANPLAYVNHIVEDLLKDVKPGGGSTRQGALEMMVRRMGEEVARHEGQA